MELMIEALQVTRQGKVEVFVTLLNDEKVAFGVNKLVFTDEWGSTMSQLLISLALPHIEELYLKNGVSVNGLGQEDETWKALLPQLASLT